MLALGNARLSTEENHWTGLHRGSQREKEEREISHPGKTTKSHRGIIPVRPEKSKKEISASIYRW